jgi:hypothetical protein
MAEQWLSIVEYARTFNISDMTIRRRIRTGRIQAYLRDGKYYIPIDTDPNTGEPIKQSSKAKAAVAANSLPMKSHPNAERTIPQVRSHGQFALEQEAYIEPRGQQSRSNYQEPLSRHMHVSEPAIKAHTAASTPHVRRPDIRVSNSVTSYSQIPSDLVSSIVAAPEVSVESQALLEYCNSSLATVKDIERHVEGHYAARMETTMEQLRTRDREISKLNQQIEDLQLLVQILERKRT